MEDGLSCRRWLSILPVKVQLTTQELVRNSPQLQFWLSLSDEYVYAHLTLNTHISTPRLRYHAYPTHQLSSFAELHCYPIKSLADATCQSMLTHTHCQLATCTLKNSTLTQNKFCEKRVSELGGGSVLPLT